jgi:hypothetical protein
VFTDVSQPKWFKIFWTDGTSSFHDARFLSRLEILLDNDEPEGLLPKPEPVKIWTAKQVDWSVATLADIQAKLSGLIPGCHSPHALQLIFDSIRSSKVFARMTKDIDRVVRPEHLEMLNASIDLSSFRVILDPFAGCHAVHKGLNVPARSKLVLNDKMRHPTSHLHMEPLEPALYRKVINTFGSLDAVITCPPLP